MTNLEYIRKLQANDLIKWYIKFLYNNNEGYCNAPDCPFSDYCNEGEQCNTAILKWCHGDYKWQDKMETHFDKWKRDLTVVDYAKMIGTQNCQYGLRCCGYDCEKFKKDRSCEFSDALSWGSMGCLK